MRVFVAGASGAVGRPLVRQLVDAGHEVTGTTRRNDRAKEIRAAGAEAAVCDCLDADALREAVIATRPEVVVHQLTALPREIDPRDPETYAATNRLRTEGTRNLIAAAAAAGSRRLVAQSIVLVYEPSGSWVKDEDAPTAGGAPGHLGEAMRAMLDLERQVGGAEGVEGLVLRYGFFYGPGTAFAPDGSYADQVRRRRFPVIGRGEGTFSFIHVDDAAAAAVAAVERGAPGIYNITDDEPAPMREWVPRYAEALGAKRPLRIPRLIAGLVGGREVVGGIAEMRGASNARAKRELGWEPLHPSWRRGFREALG
jgi:nucleoside-diphosphate-sugar epimerase